jgi:hypothetical protein
MLPLISLHAFQHMMARPPMRGRRLPTPSRRGLATRKQLLRPLDCSPNPRCQTALVKCSRNRRGPLLAQQTLYQTLHPPPRTGLVLPRLVRHARGGRTTRLEHRGPSSNTASWLYTRRGAIYQFLRATHAAYCTAPPVPLQISTAPQGYRLTTDTPHAHWSASMVTKYRDLLVTDRLGTTAISLLSSSLAPSTYASYDSALRQYFAL